MPKTIIDKLWDAHIVRSIEKGPDVLYIDLHLLHEVTSPQAFKGLENRGAAFFRTERAVATVDHNVPTVNQHLPIKDVLSRLQVDTLSKNCEKHGIRLFGLGHPSQGIVHVIGPELGFTQPGMTIVCGDSHTSTHGAFGCLAFGIGTSQVEQVMASQCLIMSRPKTMRVWVEGKLNKGVTAKDVTLKIIADLGTEGATGYFVEYAGPAIEAMSMEERMTLCNMSIEMGARGGLVAPDKTTFAYLKGKEYAPKGADFEEAVAYWKTLASDRKAKFDRETKLDADSLGPIITFGTSPDTGVDILSDIPQEAAESHAKALEYMGFVAGDTMLGKKIDYVFVGSCTNSRIEDLRAAASLAKGRKKAEHVQVWVVPGSRKIMEQAQREGLDKIFLEAGFEFREPGCSACLAMNDDKIPAGALCVSTSNRNFEGRQGEGARTLLASPVTATASAISGYIDDPRRFLN